MKQEFLEAITSTRLIELTFDSKSSGVLTRTCAPMDYGPSRRSNSSEPKYHFHNVTSNHPMPISEEQIKAMVVLEETFNPKEIVNWQPNWFISRDWGECS